MRRNKARVSGEAFTPFLLVEPLHGRNVWCSIHDAGYLGNDSLEWMERWQACFFQDHEDGSFRKQFRFFLTMGKIIYLFLRKRPVTS